MFPCRQLTGQRVSRARRGTQRTCRSFGCRRERSEPGRQAGGSPPPRSRRARSGRRERPKSAAMGGMRTTFETRSNSGMPTVHLDRQNPHRQLHFDVGQEWPCCLLLSECNPSVGASTLNAHTRKSHYATNDSSTPRIADFSTHARCIFGWIAIPCSRNHPIRLPV